MLTDRIRDYDDMINSVHDFWDLAEWKCTLTEGL